MKPVMYIFLNKGLGMSTGKAAAQAAHAAVEAYRLSTNAAESGPDGERLIDAWYKGGHYTKIVLEARDEAQLHTIDRYLRDRGQQTALIIDEGRTEISAFSATALGVAIVDKDDEYVAATFSSFKTYKDLPPEPDFNRTRIPETEEFKELYDRPDQRPPGADQKSPDPAPEPWWVARYKNDPTNISKDINAAGAFLRAMKK